MMYETKIVLKRLQILALTAALGISAIADAAVWVSGEKTVSSIDAHAGRILDRFEPSGELVGRLGATSDGRLWVLSDDHLQLIGPGRSSTSRLNLRELGYPAATLLAVDPYDHSVWVATAQNSLLRVDATATPTATFSLPAKARSAAVADDESLWVAGDRAIWQLNTAGQVVSQLDLPELVDDVPTALVVDGLRSRLWVITSNGAKAIEVSTGSKPRGILELSLPGAKSLALDVRTGVLWALTNEAVNAFNADGRPVAVLSLESIGAVGTSSIGFDTELEVLALAGMDGTIILSSTGGKVSRIETGNPDAQVSVTPWTLVPTVEIQSPAAGSVINNRRPEVVLKIGAVCSKANCQLSSQYLARFQVEVKLNGSVIHAPLAFNSARTFARLRLPTDLPNGRHVFTAAVTSPTGHRSEIASTYWTVRSAGSDQPDTGSIDNGIIEGPEVGIGGPSTPNAPNAAPSATLTAPTAGATFAAGATITLSANASDSDGTVTKVDFFRGGSTLIGTDTSSPYSINWPNVPAGSYSLTARATDNGNKTGTSSAVAITVSSNVPPTVSITSPSGPTTVTAGTSLTVTASASDSNGTVSMVEFFDGSNLLATDTNSPYQFVWSNISVGLHTLTARATDNASATTTSAPVSVNAVSPPLVVITSPASCGQVNAPATVVLTADAESPGGSITQVQFYQGANLVGTDTTRPFTTQVTGLTAGTYLFTARATDTSGLDTTSRAVEVRVGAPNIPPTVSLTSPANGAVFGPAPDIVVSANASDSDGTVVSVAFVADGTLALGSDSLAPFSVTWNDAPAGTHSLIATATDDRSGVTSSAPISITVNQNSLPTVSVTSPQAGASFYAPAQFTVSADAADTDGTVTNVEFFLDSSSIGSSSVAPFIATATNVAAGAHNLTARATDNLGGQSTSAPVSVTVLANSAPTVALTEPANLAVYFAPAVIRLSATASDSDGSITRVDFFAGSTQLGSATSAPYSVIWNNAGAGVHALTAVAVDDRNVSTTSTPVSITINSGPLISFAPGLDGSTVSDDRINLSGTVIAPTNSGVNVNGMRALYDRNGHFYANRFPLNTGTNELTVTVITEDGQSVSHTISVTSGTPAPFTVAMATDTGFPILLNDVTIVNRASIPFKRIDIDLDGNGTIDYVTTSLINGQLALAVQYPSPGVYTLHVTAIDMDDLVIYDNSQKIVVLDPIAEDQLVQSIWNRLNVALVAGNLEKASILFQADVRPTVLPVLTALQPRMEEIVASYSPLQKVSLTSTMAEYAINRMIEGVDTLFFIEVFVDADGVWRFPLL